MVRVWDIEAKNAIKLTKSRIKTMEEHGMGDSVMEEKNTLKKQERKIQLKREETGRKI